MRINLTFLPLGLMLFTLLAANQAQAQSAFGGEIVSYHTFGEGLSVTRAKVAPVNGTVSNIFFYNRADEPWKGNEWLEYDWELRGGFTDSGMSQIRVRPQGEPKITSAPKHLGIDGDTSTELLHYILIRKDNRYVYDVRRNFNVTTYDFNITGAHEGNSASALINGPRVYFTDNRSGNGTPDHIPSWRELDFSLGVTAFDIVAWSGALPEGNFDGVMQVDFTRFYAYTNNELDTSPTWSDEFIGSSLDFGKWYTADWTFHETQFRLENIKVQDGSLFLRVNRGGSVEWDPTAGSLPVSVEAVAVDTVAIETLDNEGDSTIINSFADTTPVTTESIVMEDSTTVATAPKTSIPETSIPETTSENQITPVQGGAGAFGWVYLLLLSGLSTVQRRLK